MPPTRQQFIDLLPFEVPVCCRLVGMKLRNDGKLSIKIRPKIYDLSALVDHGMGISSGASLKTIRSFATDNEIKRFLAFYLKRPIGFEMLIGSHRRLGNQQGLRHLFLNFSFQAWRELSSPRGKNGRMKSSVVCIAFTKNVGYDDELCRNKTKDASGLCRYHNKPDARTLWNFFPDFE